MIAGAVNYVFWHDQFIGLDLRYTIAFVVLPWMIGFLAYYRMNKLFIKSIWETRSSGLIDTIGSNALLFLSGLIFSYVLAVTPANIAFKFVMDFSVIDKPIITKTYVVESTVRNDVGRGVHFFSHIYYLNGNHKKQSFDVGVNSVATSYEKKKITFQCKEGFWGYCKITNYKME